MSNSSPSFPLRLNLVEGAVSFSFTYEAAVQLRAELNALLERLKVIAKSAIAGGPTRPDPQQPMEYRHVGDVFLEVFCNPNIWPTPFSAKVLITVRDSQIRLTTEAELTRIVEDINHYLEQDNTGT